MLFYAGFLLTRKFCGGFHASTYIRSIYYLAFNHLVFIAFDKFFPHQYDLPTVIISGVFCIISIILFAPIDHKNKPFTKGEYYFFRKCSFILSGAILVGLTVSVVFMNVLPYFISVVFGVFICYGFYAGCKISAAICSKVYGLYCKKEEKEK